MKLLYKKSKEEVKINDTVFSFRGEKYTVVSMTKPLHACSTGRIVVKNEHRQSEFFPSVFDLEWSQQ
jgi:hypothetical protein